MATRGKGNTAEKGKYNTRSTGRGRSSPSMLPKSTYRVKRNADAAKKSGETEKEKIENLKNGGIADNKKQVTVKKEILEEGPPVAVTPSKARKTSKDQNVNDAEDFVVIDDDEEEEEEIIQPPRLAKSGVPITQLLTGNQTPKKQNTTATKPNDTTPSKDESTTETNENENNNKNQQNEKKAAPTDPTKRHPLNTYTKDKASTDKTPASESNNAPADGNSAEKNGNKESEAATATTDNTTKTYAQRILNFTAESGWRYVISFPNNMEGCKKNEELQLARHAAVIRSVLEHVLNTGKSIDSKFAILPWNDATAAPIENNAQIPVLKSELLKYADPEKLVIRNGMNYFWRMKYQHPGIGNQHFQRAWERSKKFQQSNSRQHGYMTLKHAPVQNSVWYEVGYIVGSSERHVMTYNEKKFRELSGESDLWLHYDNVDLKNLRMGYWQQANAMASKLNKKGPSNFFKIRAVHSPTAFGVYTTNLDVVNKLKSFLKKNFGKQDKATKLWPRLPDGSRCLFVPAMNQWAKTEASKMIVRRRMDTHIRMKKALVRMPLPIINPEMTCRVLQGKTIGEAILEVKGELAEDQDLFHAIELKWNKDPNVKEYEITCFQVFQTMAIKEASQIRDTLVAKYGNDIDHCFIYTKSKNTNDLEDVFGIPMDDDNDEEDPFLSGKVQFQFDISEVTEAAVDTPRHPTSDMSTLKSTSVYSTGDQTPTALAPGFNPLDGSVPEPTGPPPEPPNITQPTSPTKATDTGTPNKSNSQASDTGFQTVGNNKLKSTMNRARMIARAVVLPRKIPHLSKNVTSSGDLNQDKHMYIRILTGNLSASDIHFLYDDDETPPPKRVEGVDRNPYEDYTDEEIESIIENHTFVVAEKMKEAANKMTSKKSPKASASTEQGIGK